MTDSKEKRLHETLLKATEKGIGLDKFNRWIRISPWLGNHAFSTLVLF